MPPVIDRHPCRLYLPARVFDAVLKWNEAARRPPRFGYSMSTSAYQVVPEQLPEPAGEQVKLSTPLLFDRVNCSVSDGDSATT